MHYKQNIPSNSPPESRGQSNYFVQVSEEQEIQIFAKQMLVHQLFIGHYQERRYVESLRSYRDVVVVHETENKLGRDLVTVRGRVQSFYNNEDVWIGITGPNMVGAPAAVCVWVKLQNMAFGYYWFQIKQVKFCGNQEVCLRLKCVRAVNPDVLNSGSSLEQKVLPTTESEPSEDGNASTYSSSPGEDDVDATVTSSTFTDLGRNQTVSSVMSSCKSLFTLRNAKDASSFVAVLFVACLTGLVNVIGYTGDFTIKFMREFSVFIQAMTPVLIAIVDFFTKCVGGFYILIAMLWRGTPANFSKQSFMADKEPKNPMLMYRPVPTTYARQRSRQGGWQ